MSKTLKAPDPPEPYPDLCSSNLGPTRGPYPQTTALHVCLERCHVAPPAPPVLFSVPYDMFYPFSVNAGPATYSPASALFASITTAMVATLLLFAPAMAPSEW